MATNIFTLQAVEFGGTGAFNLIQNEQRTADPGLQIVMNYESGEPAPSYIGVMSGQPVISGSTTEVGRFLTNVNYQTGVAVLTGGSGLTSCNAWYAAMAVSGTRKGASSHLKIIALRALVIPKSLSVRQGGEASISYEIHAYSSTGAVSPFTYTTGASLAVASSAADQKYTLGPVQINGTAVDGVQGWSLDFGLSVHKEFDSGNTFPVQISLLTTTPVFTVETDDILNQNTFTSIGTAISSTTAFYLRKLSPLAASPGTRIADATTAHVKFSFSTGYVQTMSASGSNNQVNTQGLQVTPTISGTTFMTVSAASAIT